MDEPEVDELVQQFRRIESKGVQPDRKPSSPLDQKLIQIMKDSINFNGQRCEIKLPWKENSNLENNCFSALIQVKSLNRRLERNPQFRDNYKKTLHIDLETNYVKPVEMQDPPPDRIWYLLHHPVENLNKPCKVRRVANAASRFRGQSLNTNLLTGPDLLNSLLGVLMRIRENQIAVLADIEGMFTQIAINQTDQSALRFLWMNDKEIQHYQFTRLIFGATCSPSCAIYVLNHCVDKNGDKYPDAVRAVKSHFYIDDYIQSRDTVAIATKRKQQTIQSL